MVDGVVTVQIIVFEVSGGRNLFFPIQFLCVVPPFESVASGFPADVEALLNLFRAPIFIVPEANQPI